MKKNKRKMKAADSSKNFAKEKGEPMESEGKSRLEGPIVIEFESGGDKEEEGEEAPKDYELDNHYDTLMRAEAVKGNPKIMKYLKPHMEKKADAHKKIMSISDIREAEKKMKY